MNKNTTRNYDPAEMYGVQEYANKGDINYLDTAPTTAPGDDESYVAQDESTGTLYVWDGVAWQAVVGGSGAISSVFGRTGAIVATSGDYSDTLISSPATATNYTPTGSTVRGHLAGIDTALATVGGATNLGYTSASTQGTVTSDTGTDATIPLATSAGGTNIAGLISPTQFDKLAGIETGATADQTDAEIETAYNNQVAQVSGAEITAGTETAIRRYSPADVKSFVDTHATGATNLGYTASATNGLVTSDTGTDATLSLADATNAGLMTPADFTKLAGIESGATADQIASEVTVTPTGNLVATDVQAGLDELQGDIDTINSTLTNLDQAIVLQGTWDASTGSFPGGGTAQAGYKWIVSVDGTVDGVSFLVDDTITAITDNASTTTFASNWFKSTSTDQVQSVAGKTGVVTLDTDDVTEATNLYYTTGRVDTWLSGKTTDDVTEGTTNLYYTDARVDTWFALQDTDGLAEGATNLYHTEARVLATVLTGFVAGAGTVLATDTLFQGLQKIVGNIDALGSYSSTFDATTSWGTASGGLYTITITAGTHGKGTNVGSVQVQEDDGTSYVVVTPDSVAINKTTGDVSISVTEAPDSRFAGKIIINS